MTATAGETSAAVETTSAIVSVGEIDVESVVAVQTIARSGEGIGIGAEVETWKTSEIGGNSVIGATGVAVGIRTIGGSADETGSTRMSERIGRGGKKTRDVTGREAAYARMYSAPGESTICG